jgi:DNA polymerase-3 subunit beta
MLLMATTGIRRGECLGLQWQDFDFQNDTLHISRNVTYTKESGTVVKVSRNSMIEAIERASLLAKEGRNNLIRIKIQENLMNISSASEEGSVNEDIIMEKTGNDLEIGFNSKYVMDALKVIEDEMIKMEFNTAVKPCLIKPLEGNSYEYLILPVRIPSN